MKAIDQLSEEVTRAKAERYSNVPAHALLKIKYSDKTTNELTKAIIKYFELHGFFVTRIQSQGQYNAKLDLWTIGQTVKGIPDIFAQGIVNDQFKTIWVEVKNKSTGDRLKPHQIEVHNKLRATGSCVIVATTFEDFTNQLKTNNA